MGKTELPKPYQMAGRCLFTIDEANTIIDYLLEQVDLFKPSRLRNVIKGTISELRYRIFHHSFGDNCWSFDIDGIEHRRGRGVVGVFEYKTDGAREISETRRRIMREIADYYKVEAYLVNLEPSMELFSIYRLMNDLSWEHLVDFTAEEMGAWLNEL